jgi:hypothetical protein
MKNKEIVQLFNDIRAFGNLNGVKFSYAIAKNFNILKPEIDIINEVLKPFNEKHKELAEKFCKKENDRPVIVNDSYTFEGKNEEIFHKEFEDLKKKNKKLLDDYDKLLEEESTIKLFKIKLSEVPENISTKQMVSIIELVEEK